jgi:xanthine dehydrogenase YagS FAD-binding subunit
LAAAAQHDGVRREYPAIAQSLALAASQQLRNMATLGGNVLQRTRCSYFRDPSFEACNKRRPGSGCAALKGVNRHHAVLGASEDCISQYPGDFAAALVALDAEVELTGPTHTRRIAFETLHRGSERPDVETDLRPGEVITRFFAPASPRSRRSLYVKVRDRQSYAFAIASAAVALELEQGQVLSARIALGAMAYRPWRARDAEAALVGRALTEASAEAAGALALSGAVGRGHNDYKIALGARTVARALLEAAKLEMDHG